MFKRLIVAISALGAVMAVAPMSAVAAKLKHAPMPCALPEQRCIADCDKDHWCNKYQCINNATVQLPFSCLESSGTCFAPHC